MRITTITLTTITLTTTRSPCDSANNQIPLWITTKTGKKISDQSRLELPLAIAIQKNIEAIDYCSSSTTATPSIIFITLVIIFIGRTPAIDLHHADRTRRLLGITAGHRLHRLLLLAISPQVCSLFRFSLSFPANWKGLEIDLGRNKLGHSGWTKSEGERASFGSPLFIPQFSQNTMDQNTAPSIWSSSSSEEHSSHQVPRIRMFTWHHQISFLLSYRSSGITLIHPYVLHNLFAAICHHCYGKTWTTAPS